MAVPTGGGPSASDGTDLLFASLYQELHRLAAHNLGGRQPGESLGTTTLIHEAYLRMRGHDGSRFESRERFFAYASRAMRSVVIDYARAKRARKRGAEFTLLGSDHLDAAGAADSGAVGSDAVDIEGLAAGMAQLDAIDPTLSELVDLHAFAGFSLVEIAGMRGVSERTAQRDWQKARLLLRHVLGSEPSLPDAPG